MSYVVGLTGGIGSGKSTIADLFAEMGVPIVDADLVARKVVAKGSPLLEKIKGHFGDDILTSEGELNRILLRQKIFTDPAEKVWLNQLLHPAIRQAMLESLAQYTQGYVLWVVPLLFENKLTHFCDRILVVDVNEEIQIQRATKRDQNSVTLIKQIMASQVSRSERLAQADDIIENNQDLNDNLVKLRQQVIKLHQFYLELSQQKIMKREENE